MTTKLHLSRVTFSCALALMLAGCQGMQAGHQAQQAKAELERAAAEPLPATTEVRPEVPASVTQDLFSLGSREPTAPVEVEPRFNVAASQVELAEFFASLVVDTDYSIAVHPDVQGRISLNLRQVTLAETLAVVEDLYGFDIRRHGRVYQVMPAGLRTETIPVNYLMLKRSGFSAISVNSGGVSQDMRSGNQQSGRMGQQRGAQLQDPMLGGQFGMQQQFSGSNIHSESETDFWKDLQGALQQMLGSGPERMVVVSPQAGLVTVRGMPDEIAAIRTFLGTAEQHLQRQVILEARIIEVTLSDEYQQGINWSNALASVRSTDFNFTTSGVTPGNSTSAALGGVTAISFSNADFSGVINLLETQGSAQVLSSPRVTAINNQKAVIKVGQDEYYVTNISSDTTATVGGTISTPSIELQPFFSGIALDVTPQIDQHGQVILHVHPSVTETAEQIKTIRLSNEDVVLPLARSNIRESDTIIRARSGEIVVIGGLMQSVSTDMVSRTPVLGSIPLLGQLFTSKNTLEQKKELVILLRPVVVEPEQWQPHIRQSSDSLNRWYP
ncbi:pilus (MSHA type) biogenesis protein MshL [Alkalimonas delamerensis]|uniref:Pilus (MSHA type) biogenesis protein MshL n=1 Tax=Alkalimonas delamerensis TaxID=265981 RepID=A0ABT9GPX2_9GAMM|nr:pilus (MSHA type) biogenesis protein MshL [Alkalimonas delamerensis]MDP4529023.1 pilus (MSHA type) biogenesis protein MshL [Alkalimonas delamerensis]